MVKRNEGRGRSDSREDEYYSLMDKGGNEISNICSSLLPQNPEYIPV
jgi:hypothetical protein